MSTKCVVVFGCSFCGYFQKTVRACDDRMQKGNVCKHQTSSGPWLDKTASSLIHEVKTSIRKHVGDTCPISIVFVSFESLDAFKKTLATIIGSEARLITSPCALAFDQDGTHVVLRSSDDICNYVHRL